MFTPQKNLWSLPPRSDGVQKNGLISGTGSGLNSISRSPRHGEASGKSKTVTFIENDGTMDQEPPIEKVSKLENELFEYQYNMGLLLIEKKEWSVKYDELQHDLAQMAGTLKREQEAHSIAMSEVEKREENLKKALGVERQCVLDLEKALREMRSEYAEIKFNTDSKLAEANALVSSVEEKSLEVEAKFHAADAKLAEVSRKSSEIERKFNELEAQENTLRRERFFFTTERETHETTLSKQREDLRDWERKLKEGEERLAEGRRLLNQREERANENDKILKKKQNDLEELQKKIELAHSTMKCKEDEINTRIASLALKEKEADDVGKSLDMKEKQLLEWEKKLNTREELEIQKQLDEHKAILEAKQKEFELEMDQKRKFHDEELKREMVEVEKKEVEITHMEEKVKKREQAIEKKMEKLREKETDLDSKSKTFREREKSFKVEEKGLEKERKQLHAAKEELLNLKAELENVRADIAKQRLMLNEKNEQLKVTTDERLEHERLQSELKQEINKCRLQNEQLLKEADDLKQEKEKFEKEWEELDDKRAEIKKELEDVNKQNVYFEKLRQSEEERLNNEKLETQQHLQRELEALKLAKDSFAASMEHEKSVLAEKSKSEKSQLLHEFELQKQEFDTEMLRRQEEMESCLQEKEKLFEEKRDAELININYLREVARREMEEMKLERNGIEKEKLEISHNKKHVEAQQCEMKKDIEELIGLSQKLKDQREQFVKERERFIAFAEKQKRCSICGEIIREFILSDLHPLTELESLDPPPLPRVAENYLRGVGEGTSVPLNSGFSPVLLDSGSPAAGGTMSWFRKCTSKIFMLSPGKKLELSSGPNPTEAASHGRHVDTELPNPLSSSENEPELLLQVANDSVDVEIMQSDSGKREVGADQAISANRNQLSTPAKSQNFEVKKRHHRPVKGARPRAVRTHSVKAVIAGAKAILGQSPKENENHYSNISAENSASLNEESRAGSDFVGTPKNRRKRNRILVSQTTVSDDGCSEGHSYGVTDDDSRKRQHRVSVAEQSFIEKRYNLRPPKVSAATLANGSLYEPRKGKGKATDSRKGEEDKLSGLMANPCEKVEIGEAPREEIHKPGASFTISRGFDGTDGDEHVKSTDATSEFSADSPVRYKIAEGTHEDHIDTANTFVAGMDLIEEINGREEGARNYSGEEFGSESHGEEEDDDSDNGDEDEVNHPGEVSVGKKLWTFLTT